MTKKQRAQVVELLRCAADNRPVEHGLNGLFGASDGLCTETALHNEAWEALFDVPEILTSAEILARHNSPSELIRIDEAYRHRLLEAAQRVEEGWTP